MAERFAAEGMKVVLADIEGDALGAAAERLAATGAEVASAEADVSSAEQVEALADAAYERFGAVHVVCNNAGVVTRGAAWDQSLDDWNWVLGVDLWGVINGVRSFVPRMLAGGEPGHLVNTASMAGLLAFPSIAPYNVAKVGVVALSETTLHDLRKAGAPIGVSVLCPGVVPTRIAESDRNRPGAQPGETPRMRVVDPGAARRARRANPPRSRELVVDAILGDRFWILTHPEYHEWIERRAGAIVDGADVVVPPTL